MKHIYIISVVLLFAIICFVNNLCSQIVYYKFNPAAKISTPTAGENQSLTINFQSVGINDSVSFSIYTLNSPGPFAALSFKIIADDNFLFCWLRRT